MISCGGQATIPIVAAVSSVTDVSYAEIVASVSSSSAGPGTRANIDEFTRTTARGVELVGGAQRGRAIIILNPANPPITMRNTVMVAFDPAADRDAIAASVVEHGRARRRIRSRLFASSRAPVRRSLNRAGKDSRECRSC